MLKHVLSTSIILALATVAVNANATQNQPASLSNFSHAQSQNNNNDSANSSVPSTKLQPPVVVPISKLQPPVVVPASRLQPPVVVPADTSQIPQMKLQPAKNISVYQALENGYRAGVSVGLENCNSLGGSQEPNDVQFMNIFFSTADGSRVTLDPNGESQTVYHYSHQFHVFSNDLTEYRGVRFIEVGPKSSTVVIKSTSAEPGANGMEPLWNYYRYTCDNQNLAFEK